MLCSAGRRLHGCHRPLDSSACAGSAGRSHARRSASAVSRCSTMAQATCAACAMPYASSATPLRRCAGLQGMQMLQSPFRCNIVQFVTLSLFNMLCCPTCLFATPSAEDLGKVGSALATYARDLETCAGSEAAGHPSCRQDCLPGRWCVRAGHGRARPARLYRSSEGVYPGTVVRCL